MNIGYCVPIQIKDFLNSLFGAKNLGSLNLPVQYTEGYVSCSHFIQLRRCRKSPELDETGAKMLFLKGAAAICWDAAVGSDLEIPVVYCKNENNQERLKRLLEERRMLSSEFMNHWEIKQALEVGSLNKAKDISRESSLLDDGQVKENVERRKEIDKEIDEIVKFSFISVSVKNWIESLNENEVFNKMDWDDEKRRECFKIQDGVRLRIIHDIKGVGDFKARKKSKYSNVFEVRLPGPFSGIHKHWISEVDDDDEKKEVNLFFERLKVALNGSINIKFSKILYSKSILQSVDFEFDKCVIGKKRNF